MVCERGPHGRRHARGDREAIRLLAVDPLCVYIYIYTYTHVCTYM